MSKVIKHKKVDFQKNAHILLSHHNISLCKMKGIVVTEFFDLIERLHDYDMVDKIIEKANPPSGGVYTAVGSYPHTEIVSLLVAYHQISGTPIEDALKIFGKNLLHTFYKNYQDFFKHSPSAIDFLQSVDGYIHIEVAKLYPDAELPKFETELMDENTLKMIYTSKRSMGHLALGLIESTFEVYNEKGEIEMNTISENGDHVEFIIKKVG